MTPALERLIEALRVLPGVGKKTATRYAYALLHQDARSWDELTTVLGDVRARVRACAVCRNWTERDICALCEARADVAGVCVVEQPGDVEAIERTAQFRGRYHVLHGALDPLAGVGVDDLHVDELVARVRREGVRELLLALSPTREGEATCRLIATLLHDVDVRLTRLAYGLPLGSHLDHLDDGTLSLALEYRREFR